MSFGCCGRSLFISAGGFVSYKFNIASATTAPRFTDYAGSVQAVMAIDTLLNALVRERSVTVGAAAGIRASINRAYAAVAAPETYRPAEFRTALASATNAIGSLR